MTEECVQVHYKIHDPMIDVSLNLNIFVACFNTCYARLKLYEELERLDQRVVLQKEQTKQKCGVLR